jgi:hypothetical protein
MCSVRGQCKAYLSRPSFIVTSWLTLKVGSLLIIENATKTIRHARGNVGHSLQWAMLRHSICNVFPWSGPQRFLVRLADRLDGCVLDVLVTRNTSGIVRTFVVVTSETSCVETVDDISSLEVLLSKMRCTVSNLFILAEYIKWPVRRVSRITLLQRATACKSATLQLTWCWIARSSRSGVVHGSESFRAVARVHGESFAARASRIGRGRVVIPPSAG